jgi:tRNA 2-thiouridine synthesizing protein A
LQLPGDDDEWLEGELDERTLKLQATVAWLTGRRCTTCNAVLCGHGAVLAVVLGYKHEPRCARCVAAEMRETPSSLADRALHWIVRRDCFAHVWRRSSDAEGYGSNDRPPCLFAAAPAAAPTPMSPVAGTAPSATATPLAAAKTTATYDAGDLGCGDLVLELRTQLRALPAGAVLHVIAHDPAAPVDLPAWCGLTGHTLLSSDHPDYLIQRKRE